MKFILGRKIGMTRIFDGEGRNIAVTKIAVLPTVVSGLKNVDRDGYKAVQIKAFRDSEEKKTVKICEFRVDQPGRYKVGAKVTTKQFKKDEIVSVQGQSKGKGFSGTIKRHGFHRGPESHGSNNVREPGSIGGGYPQRVVPGRRMAGKMGNETVTVKNLKIVDFDDELILISGAVPGPVKSVIKIFGTGEIAEEEVDHTAEQEALAEQQMLEAEEEAKSEPEEKKEEIVAPEE